MGAYDNVHVCYDMNIKCTMSKKLLGRSETVVLFITDCFIRVHCIEMNVLLK